MSATQVNTGDAGVQQIWDEEFFRDVVKESYFEKMKSVSGNMPVHEKMDLTKKAGETINFTIRYRPTDISFLSPRTLIEGNEADFTTSAETITVNEYNFGMRFYAGIDKQRAVYELEEETRRVLVETAAELVDLKYFSALRATNTDIYYPVSGVFTNTSTLSTATAAITASDKLTPEDITKIKAVALTDRANGRVPLKPIMISGSPHLVLLVHPYQVADLKLNSTFTQAKRDAEVRSKDNPIFTGAVGMWDGVIIHEHDNITKNTNGGAGGDVPYAQAYLMGQQALVSAIAQKPTVVKEVFSYGQQVGFGYKSIWECLKPQFTKSGESAKDYGSLCLVTALTNLK